MAIDLSELTYDEDFCTTFRIEKHETTWNMGRPETSSTVIPVTGIVMPSSAEDIEMLEEGDRKHGLKSFYTNMAYMDVSGTLTTSDVVIWNGKRYKLLHVFDYTPNGYCKAIGDLIGGDAGGDIQGA